MCSKARVMVLCQQLVATLWCQIKAVGEYVAPVIPEETGAKICGGGSKAGGGAEKEVEVVYV